MTAKDKTRVTDAEVYEKSNRMNLDCLRKKRRHIKKHKFTLEKVLKYEGN